jgi:hypothetical protein
MKMSLESSWEISALGVLSHMLVEWLVSSRPSLEAEMHDKVDRVTEMGSGYSKVFSDF